MDLGGPSPEIEFDHAALDAAERRFWRDVWSAAPPQVGAERGVATRSFGPVEALAIAALPDVPMLNLVLGAGELGAAAEGQLAAAGFGLPDWMAGVLAGLPGRAGWRCYVAEVDGSARAAAAMRIHGGVAELGLAATLDDARGRGCQIALLRQRVLDAAAAQGRAP